MNLNAAAAMSQDNPAAFTAKTQFTGAKRPVQSTVIEEYMGIKRDKYDAVFSDLVRCRANWTCEHCGKNYPDSSTRSGLHCSHHFGRRYQSTRYDPENAMSLCFGCHNKVAEDPDMHRRIFIEWLGEGGYQLLIERKNSIKKWLKGEKDEMRKFYAVQLKAMIAARSEGCAERIEFNSFL